ncbi:DNA polymerase III subunit gamma/tau, partial [bacterium]
MAAQALYRRWRPQSFDDVLGQDHIIQTLRNAVATQRLAHAYLFTGPRGTGKTSVARILAKAVNCTGAGDARPCNACPTCVSMTEGRSMDLIEIDAASNTGVDDVRDLRDKIGFAPTEARYKVYIVDEVHMLSTAAFNALLKTLEEPPGHAIFILATTEVHKIPDTILSRCQRHDFRRQGVAVTAAKLARICAAEGVTADPAALELVARAATGSLRDAESLLDQLVATGDAISVEAVQAILGVPTGDVVAGLVDAVIAADGGAGLRLINGAVDRGTDVRQLQSQILGYLRGLLLIQTGVDADLLAVADDTLARMRDQAGRLPTTALVPMIHRFNEARPAADRALPSLPLELALMQTVLGGGPEAGGAPAAASSGGGGRGTPAAPAGALPREHPTGAPAAVSGSLPASASGP